MLRFAGIFCYFQTETSNCFLLFFYKMYDYSFKPVPLLLPKGKRENSQNDIQQLFDPGWLSV